MSLHIQFFLAIAQPISSVLLLVLSFRTRAGGGHVLVVPFVLATRRGEKKSVKDLETFNNAAERKGNK